MTKHSRESKTWIYLGGIVGFFIGAISGVVLISSMIITPFTFEGLENLSPMSLAVLYSGTVLLATFWGCAAGTLVGIGVPRYRGKLQPPQWIMQQELIQTTAPARKSGGLGVADSESNQVNLEG